MLIDRPARESGAVFKNHLMKPIFSLLLFITALSATAQIAFERRGVAAWISQNKQPMLILGGELGNSTASMSAELDRALEKMQSMHFNTALVPAYWDLLEPEEGQFDFAQIDNVLEAARRHDMRIVFLWFGAWKNSMSCYAPLWFKADYERFPRAKTAEGKPLEIASAFSENVFQADSKALRALLEHVKKADVDGRVIMIQIENEIGMLEDARDHSAEANRLFAAEVPSALIDHLSKNKDALHPKMAERWKANGNRTSGTWSKVFGTDIYADEIFMAYHYAAYVERMAQVAKEICELPLYVNAAMNSRGRQPGQYPSAGPLAHLKDVWHAAAPSLCMLSPDVYDSNFDSWISQYALADNPLFIPEMRLCEANAAQALYAFGQYEAVGVSPFSIENIDKHDKLGQAYKRLREATPIIVEHRGKGETCGFLFDQKNNEKIVEIDGLRIRARHYFTLPWDPRATNGSAWPEAGAMLIKLADDEYLLCGTGVVLEFADPTEHAVEAELGEDGFANTGDDQNGSQSKWKAKNRVGIGFVDDIRIDDDGAFVRLGRLNGDEDHQGRHVRIGVDDVKILHIKLYRYK